MDIRIGGREIPMTLTTFEMIAIQEEIGCTVGQLRDEVFGLKQNLETDEYTIDIVEDKDKLLRFGRLIKILGNAGLEEAGKEPDLNEKWILRHMKPSMIVPYLIAISSVISDAMRMEYAEKNSGSGPVDEVLEEENRKKDPGSLPTGESAPADSSPD